MGKKAREQRRSLTAVEDAVALVKLTRRMADFAHLPPGGSLALQVQRQAGGVTQESLHVWGRNRIVLRCDSDFADALLSTDRDTEVPATCFERFPFDSVMVSFTRPFDLHDGQDLCRYHGVLVVGATTSRELPPGVRAPEYMLERGSTPTWTTYGSVADNEMVRFSWFFMFPGTNMPGMQTITLPWKGDLAHSDHTVAQLIEGIRGSYRHAQDLPGGDLDVLVPLSVALLLYLGSAEPDIDRPILLGGDGTGASNAVAGVRVGNMGFRIGAALRDWRLEPSHSSGPSAQASGRRLPPHIRSAHWHRFRVASRDAEGRIIGDRLGEKDTDWHYELRWIPPTPVNVGEDGPQPVIRDLC